MAALFLCFYLCVDQRAATALQRRLLRTRRLLVAPGSLARGARTLAAGAAPKTRECVGLFGFKLTGYLARSSRPLLVFGPFTDQPLRPALKLCSRLSALWQLCSAAAPRAQHAISRGGAAFS